MPEKNPWLLPVAIIAAGALIGIAIFVIRAGTAPAGPASDIGALRPVSTEDHIVGNPDANVVIVEYSDIDCEYCKDFREALEELMADYGPDGGVAWVYRHFPVTQAHPNAEQHAEAAECVASLAGNDAFFRFIDALNQSAPGSQEFDPKGYDAVVSSLGISADSFDACMKASTFATRVGDDLRNGLQIGVNGTPYSIILVKGFAPIPVSGALPYPALKKVVETALAKASTE